MVDRVHQDEDKVCWHVTYSDFDEEDLEAAQLAEVLLYHPLMDHAGDVAVPRQDSFVWFARNNLPVLGKVLAVDPTISRQVSVQLYQPAAGSKNVVTARYVPVSNGDGQPEVMQLTVQQVVLGVDVLTKGGYLRTNDRRRLQTFLKS